MVRKLLLGLAALLTFLPAAQPAVADGGSLPPPVIPADRSARLEAGVSAEFSELASPLEIQIPSHLPVEIRDDLSGRLVVPRSISVEKSGKETSLTRVVLPQLPVGTFTVTAGDFRSLVAILPEGGSPIEVSGIEGGSQSASPLLLLLLSGTGVGVFILLRRRPRVALLGMLPLLLAGGLMLLPEESPSALSWEECDAYTSTNPVESEILRRDCKVRTVVTLLRSDGSGRAEVERLLASSTDQACHEIAHLSGFYFSRMQADPATAAEAMILGCNDGMVHGVLEAIGVFSSDDDFLERTTGTCFSLPTERERKTCAHGLGHAALWRTVGDLDKAWDLCSRVEAGPDPSVEVLFNRFVLTDTRYSASSECLSASVMEWADRWEFERVAGTDSVLIPDLDQPMDICTRYEVEESFQVGCYLGTNYRTQEPALAAERCNKEAPYPISCFATIGDNIAQFSEVGRQRVDLTVEYALGFAKSCDLATLDDAATACARHLAYRHHLSRQSVNGDETRGLCDRLPARLEAGCRDGLLLASDVLAEAASSAGARQSS